MTSSKYQAYSEYKNSEIEWVGHIPEHWGTSYLGFECSVKARLGWRGLKADEYVDEGFVFLATPNIKDKEIDFENVDRITKERYDESPEIMLREGDVLVTKDGSTTGTTNAVRFLPEPATVNSSIAVLRTNGKVLSVFLFYFFTSDYTQNIINRMRGGMGVPHLFQADLRKFDLLIPPEEEQQKIASFLDHETAKIDTLIEKQQQLIKLLKEKRQSVISYAVTKGLNPDVPMRDSGVEWLGEVPEHWLVTRAKFLFDFVTSGSRGWAEYYADDGSLFFRIANLTRNTIEPKFESIQLVNPPFGSEGVRAKIQKNDLLISITADLGSVCVANEEVVGGYVSQHVSLCRPNKGVESSRWLGYFILSDLAKEQLLGSGYGGTKIQLSLEDIRELWLVQPKAIEQTEIADFIDNELVKFAKLMERADDQILLLQERRTTLISAAVTGKIDVRNWKAAQC